MIKLKDLLLEMSSLNLLIARRVEGRTEKYIQAKIKQFETKNGYHNSNLTRQAI